MFTIQFNSGVPIYRQVVEQVIHLIDRGQLLKGDLLPSVRKMASELGVNPMTISRAYSTLEQDSVVERRRGVGMVVIRQAQKPNKLLDPAIHQLVSDARQLGLNEKELMTMIRSQWKKKGKQ